MSDQYIEKSFIYLVVVSLLLHAGVFAALYYLPQSRQEPPNEPVFLDLQNMTEPKQHEQAEQKKVERLSDKRIRVERETAPSSNDRINLSSKHVTKSQSTVRIQSQIQQRSASTAVPAKPSPATIKPLLPTPSERRSDKAEDGSSVTSLLKPRKNTQQSLNPSLSVRREKYYEVEDPSYKRFQDVFEKDNITRIDADDYIYGSLYKRINEQLINTYTHRYISEEDKNKIHNQIGSKDLAYAVVVMTINKNGDVLMDKTYILQSSGIKTLDDYILDSIRRIGPLGRLPKQHKGDELHMPQIFYYGVVRRMVR